MRGRNGSVITLHKEIAKGRVLQQEEKLLFGFIVEFKYRESYHIRSLKYDDFLHLPIEIYVMNHILFLSNYGLI